MRYKAYKYFILKYISIVSILLTQHCFGSELIETNQNKLPELPEPILTHTIHQKNTTIHTQQQTNILTDAILPTIDHQDNKENPQIDNKDITNIPLIIKKDQYDIDTNELTIEENNTETNTTKVNEDIQDYNPEFIDPNIEQDTKEVLTTNDKREFFRFSNTNLTHKITVSQSNYINNILDISRGGIGFVKNNKCNNLKVGDTIQVKIAYKEITIPLEIEILAITNNRICTKYINLTEEQENKILYLNIILEAENNMLKTKIIG